MNPATVDVTTVGTYITGADGTVKIDLPLGLYRVTEIQAPSGYNATNEAFLVTLPMTNPENRSEWMYDVHVYPKNNPVDPTLPFKSVVDVNANAGDTINYTITAPVQAVVDDLTHFRIVDKYPSNRLEKPSVDAVTFNGTELLAGDYVVNTSTTGEVAISLTTTGLAKVNAVDSTAERTIEAKLSFTVSAITGDPNTAVPAVVNDVELTQSTQEITDPSTPPPGTPPTTPTTDTQPKSFFGNVKLVKTGEDAVGNEAKLAGASFQVYRCNSVDELGAMIDGFSGTTNANGELYITGLQANDYQNGAPLSSATKYCLVETQAAPGYELLTTPFEFQLIADLTTNTVPTVELKAEIENVQANAGFELPLNGGKGVAIILGAGLILLIAGGAYYLMQRRES